MYTYLLVVGLGLYMLVMGIIGYRRTKSPTALYVNGGIAVITIILGLLMSKENPFASTALPIWLALNAVMLGYLTIKRIRMGAEARGGSKFIFGSMTILTILVLIVVGIQTF